MSLNFQQTKQRYQFLWSHDGQNPGEIQELLKSAAQCHVETDSKWPDSSIPGFWQEVDTGSLLEKLVIYQSKNILLKKQAY